MYQETRPNHLKHLVRAIWTSDSDVDPNEGHVALPSLGPQLVIKIYQSDVEVVLSGPVTQQKHYPFVEGANYIGVHFAPTVGPLFADTLLKDLKDTSVGVNKVLGIDLESLADQISTLKTWTEHKHLIEIKMSERYPASDHFLNHNVLFALDVAQRVYGNISVRELALVVGVSKRHLERLFLVHTGVSPKTVCTMLRMQRFLDLLHRYPTFSLAQLALECGYTDQAHLSNEFRRMMGTSILAYIKSLSPLPEDYSRSWTTADPATQS